MSMRIELETETAENPSQCQPDAKQRGHDRRERDVDQHGEAFVLIEAKPTEAIGGKEQAIANKEQGNQIRPARIAACAGDRGRLPAFLR